MQHGTWSSPAHQTRHLGKGLHRAHLVVDQLDRHNADGPVERRAQGFQVDNAVISHLDHSKGGTEEALRPLRRVQYRVVLDRAYYDRPGRHRCPSQYGQVGRLCATAGENQVARGRPKDCGNLVTRLVDCLASGSGDRVGAGRVTEAP